MAHIPFSAPLAARGVRRRRTETGGALLAKRDDREYPEYLREEQRSQRGMHRPSNAAGVSPRAAGPFTTAVAPLAARLAPDVDTILRKGSGQLARAEIA